MRKWREYRARRRAERAEWQAEIAAECARNPQPTADAFPPWVKAWAFFAAMVVGGKLLESLLK